MTWLPFVGTLQHANFIINLLLGRKLPLVVSFKAGVEKAEGVDT